MNISGGLSAINLSPSMGTTGASKVYLWPDYAAGNVEKIQPVIRETTDKQFYTKSSDEDKERIIAAVREHQDLSYSPIGKILQKNPVIRPGILFDATV